MEKLLLIGVNNRALLNSASKLKYQTYSVSYFSTVDFKESHKEKHILIQKPGKSCGLFEEDYNPNELLKSSLEFMEESDKIILSGISPSDFKGPCKKHKKKIIGNHNINIVEDKYKFYKKIKKDFSVPKTYKVDYEHIDEIVEILKQHPKMSFIIKPVKGSGGYGVQYLNHHSQTQLNEGYFEKYFSQNKGQYFLVQEFIKGNNISSSVLATKHQSKNIVNSKMLNESDFGEKNNFKYSGNIIPYKNIFKNSMKRNLNYSEIDDKIISDISEKIISKFGLIGSNGVDMIIENNYDSDNRKYSEEDKEIYIIEVNPRFQGTYECIEKIFGINLLEAHIKAYNGELIDIPKAKYCSMKRIIYTKERVKVGNLSIDNVYDIPYNGVIIEKNQPLVTVVSSGKNFRDNKNKINNAIFNVNKNIYPYDN